MPDLPVPKRKYGPSHRLRCIRNRAVLKEGEEEEKEEWERLLRSISGKKGVRGRSGENDDFNPFFEEWLAT